MDTGCGYDLIFPRKARELDLHTYEGDDRMVFMTANGMTETKEVAKCSVDSFSEETKPFVLEQSPAVFSVDVDQFRMDDVLAEPPSDLRFTGPTEKYQRIPIDQLRPVRTVNPLTNVDFDSVNPKPMMKEDRMWFPILPRTSPEGNEFHQNDSSKMHMCSQCSRDKLSGIYNDREDYATHCPNCASNFCRKFYFDQHDPCGRTWSYGGQHQLFWRRKRFPGFGETWGPLTTSVPGCMRRSKSSETIQQGSASTCHTSEQLEWVLKLPQMPCIKGKETDVSRQTSSGRTRPGYRLLPQFSFDHGNRMYSDYMRLMFTAGKILSITGNGDPKEELLGDCIETCLGILRVALMYEGCGVDLFGWGSIVEILTGLEHSLLVFNASAYPSGLRNRKIGSSKKSKKSYSFDDCLDVPTEGVPLSKFPIGTIEVTSNETDVEIWLTLRR